MVLIHRCPPHKRRKCNNVEMAFYIYYLPSQNDDNGHLYESIRDPLPPPLPHPRSQGTVTVLESSSDLRDDLQQNIAYVPSHGVKTDLAANHEQTIDVETSHIDTVPNVAYQDSSTCNEYLKIV